MLRQEIKDSSSVATNHKTKITVSLFQAAKLSLQMERNECPRNISQSPRCRRERFPAPTRALLWQNMKLWLAHCRGTRLPSAELREETSKVGLSLRELMWAPCQQIPYTLTPQQRIFNFQRKNKIKKENIKRKRLRAMPWHSIPDTVVLPASPAPSKPTALKGYPNALLSPAASPLPPSTPGRLLFCLFFLFSLFI